MRCTRHAEFLKLSLTLGGIAEVYLGVRVVLGNVT